MKNIVMILALVPLFLGCKPDPVEQEESWKQEIIAMEAQFEQMVAEQGIQAAFTHFAAEDGVMNRGNKVYKGKQAIFEKLASQSSPDQIKLKWKPDFVGMSATGDLAYTYGTYQLTKLDADGKATHKEGIFHTVWQRQANGQWRYVWD